MSIRRIIVLLCLLALTTAAQSAGTSRDKLLNKPAPAFTLADVQGDIHSLSDWKGKLIILNFWATWCSPCKEEIPLLNKLQNDYGYDGLQMVGIAIDNRNAVRQFNNLIPVEYVNLIAGTDGAKLVSRYGNTAGVLPYTVIISPQGTITSIAQGLLTETYLRRIIEKNI